MNTSEAEYTVQAGWDASKLFSWAFILMGFIALAMSFVIAVEKIHLLEDPNFVPSCTVNTWISCGSVMESPQANAFGFPNPLIGLVGFPVVMSLGVVLAQGIRLPKWMWWCIAAGLTCAVIFVHWLAYNAMYEIVALCPYCMVVWAMTFPLWIMTIVHISRQRILERGGQPAYNNVLPVVVVVAWYAAIAVLIWEQFIL